MGAYFREGLFVCLCFFFWGGGGGGRDLFSEFYGILVCAEQVGTECVCSVLLGKRVMVKNTTSPGCSGKTQRKISSSSGTTVTISVQEQPWVSKLHHCLWASIDADNF